MSAPAARWSMRAGLALLLGAAAIVALLFAGAREPAGPGPGSGFDLLAFFEGSSVSRGSITTLLVRREDFTAGFAGAREGGTFRLEERFAFEDGARLQVWTLASRGGGYAGTVETERGDGTLQAPVPVDGVANEDGVILTYDGIAPGGGRTTFRFRHTMRLNADGTVANHVVVSKFGLPIATSQVVFAKAASALPSPSGDR